MSALAIPIADDEIVVRGLAFWDCDKIDVGVYCEYVVMNHHSEVYEDTRAISFSIEDARKFAESIQKAADRAEKWVLAQKEKDNG